MHREDLKGLHIDNRDDFIKSVSVYHTLELRCTDKLAQRRGGGRLRFTDNMWKRYLQ